MGAFAAACYAARPERWLIPVLSDLTRPPGRTLVLSLGKGAIPMAEAFGGAWTGDWTGLAVAPKGEARVVPGFEVLEASHPVPDASSLAAGEASLAFAARAGPQDLLLVLVSGGASSLLCAPIPGVSLEQKAAVTGRLLASGAGIAQINAVRRALSRVKGGGLSRAGRAGRTVTIAQSDVPDDNPADIGSGPGLRSPTTVADALAVLTRHAPDLLEAVAGPIHAFAAERSHPIGRVSASVPLGISAGAAAAAEFLRDDGWEAGDLGSVSGDADLTGRAHAALLTGGRRALVSGGELSLAVPRGAKGRGGRNQHYLLSLAVELAGRNDIWALAADTDGIDGSSDAAGAWIDPALLGTLDRIEAEAALADFDAHGFFERHDRLIRTGPTGVNLGDLRIVLVDPA